MNVTSVGILDSIFSTMRYKYAVSPEEALGGYKLMLDAFLSENSRVPMSLMVEVWCHAEQLVGDRSFGLDVISYTNSTNLRGLDMLMATAPSIKNAVEVYSDFLSLLHLDFVSSTNYDMEGNLRIVFPEFSKDKSSKSSRVYAIALNSNLFELSSGKKINEIVERVEHNSNRYIENNYLDSVKIPVLFAKDNTAIVFKKNILDTPMPYANIRLFSQLERRAMCLLEKDNITLPYRSLVNQLSFIVRQSDSIARFSRALALNEKTVARSLEFYGKSFLALRDAARNQAALRMLGSGRFRVSEVADFTGYSTSATFIRAFQRWHGVSPTEYPFA